MKNLTVSQLRKICKANRFIAIRYSSNNMAVGINCKTAFMLQNKNKPNIETQIMSYYPIDFNEYISIKIPFVT